jgi:predicted tellurium resistance membrane protein TerC
MLEWMLTADGWIAFLTLFAMEVVLGIDNLIFISILADRLPQRLQARARYIGLGLALIMRIALLLALTAIMRLTAPLFSVFGEELSGRDIVLLLGGLFLIAKATLEIHHMVEGRHEQRRAGSASFGMVIAQIVAIDLVFSLDSIITAVGLTNDIGIMISAVIASMVVMVVAVGPVSDFVTRHPTAKMLALAFLVLIGAVLVANGLDVEIPKGYVYTAMLFAVLVEGLNIAARSSRTANARALDAAANDILSDLLVRARHKGASAIQLAADDTGAVWCWMAVGKALEQDNACAALGWKSLRSALDAYVKSPQPAGEDGARHAVAVCFSPPDARPAALITLRGPT